MDFRARFCTWPQDRVGGKKKATVEAVLLVWIHFIIAMISWTGLAPREFEFPFPGSLTHLPSKLAKDGFSRAGSGEESGGEGKSRESTGTSFSERKKKAAPPKPKLAFQRLYKAPSLSNPPQPQL